MRQIGKKMFRQLNERQGFTLLELIIIIVILGVLAAVALMQFGSITTDAKKAAVNGVVGNYGPQIAAAVHSIGGRPSASDAGTGNFQDEVFAPITVTGDVVVSGTAGCDGTECKFWIASSSDCDVAGGTGQAGETRDYIAEVVYTGATGALTVGGPSLCSIGF